MSIMRLARSLFGRDVRRPRQSARFRPQVTALESRWLPATITEFPLPPLNFNPLPATEGITAGPDGNAWFTEPVTGVIGRITPAGQVTEFPTPVSNPGAITAGPDGNLWFTGGSLLNDPSISRITLAGQVTKFDLPDRLGVPTGIAAGPDGNLWFTERIYLSGEKVGRITPAGQLTEFTIPGPSGVASSIGSITVGPDSNLWFVHDGTLATITPTGALRDHVVDNVGDVALTTGPDGNLWAAGTVVDPQTGLAGNGFIDRISVTGSVTRFDMGSPDNIPVSIQTGPDGNLWFTQPSIDQIGRITPAGQVSTFPVPTAFSEPTAIVAGPNGNMWFTEVKSRQIGEYFLVGTPPAPAAATTTTLAADLSAPAVGQMVHLTATVTSAAGTPAGTVTFFDAHSGALGTASLDARGRAVLATALSPTGTHTLTAVFNGTASFAPSQSPTLRETVKRTNTTTTLAASANPVVVGQALMLTVKVQPAFAGAGAPRGKVVLKDGNNAIGSATLDSSGRAVFTFSPGQMTGRGRSRNVLLPHGTHHLTASFTGFGDFAASASATLELTVGGGRTT
jgi:streptogramin lyase